MFAVIALEAVKVDAKTQQVIVLAPTRELAVQIHSVLTSIGQHTKVRSSLFIGGFALAVDVEAARTCHIAVGTPGRIIDLMVKSRLVPSFVRLLILDEADKLMDPSFKTQINAIISMLPQRKQILALSATYPTELAAAVQLYMRSPVHIRLNADAPSLEGVSQFYDIVTSEKAARVNEIKTGKLFALLNQLTFRQCVIFCNLRSRAQQLATDISNQGFPASHISSSLDQEIRNQRMKAFKDFSTRVLVSTDLTSRGVDIERVNLVVNFDVPRDVETYLHRIGQLAMGMPQTLCALQFKQSKHGYRPSTGIDQAPLLEICALWFICLFWILLHCSIAGRTGRFGTRGVAVTYVLEAGLASFHTMLQTCQTEAHPLPASIDTSLYEYDNATDNTEATQHAKVSVPQTQPTVATDQAKQKASPIEHTGNATNAPQPVQTALVADGNDIRRITKLCKWDQGAFAKEGCWAHRNGKCSFVHRDEPELMAQLTLDRVNKRSSSTTTPPPLKDQASAHGPASEQLPTRQSPTNAVLKERANFMIVAGNDMNDADASEDTGPHAHAHACHGRVRAVTNAHQLLRNTSTRADDSSASEAAASTEDQPHAAVASTEKEPSNATVASELRIDETDGIAYSCESFLKAYGTEDGQYYWESAEPVATAHRAGHWASEAAHGNSLSQNKDTGLSSLLDGTVGAAVEIYTPSPETNDASDSGSFASLISGGRKTGEMLWCRTYTPGTGGSAGSGGQDYPQNTSIDSEGLWPANHPHGSQASQNSAAPAGRLHSTPPHVHLAAAAHAMVSSSPVQQAVHATPSPIQQHDQPTGTAFPGFHSGAKQKGTAWDSPRTHHTQPYRTHHTQPHRTHRAAHTPPAHSMWYDVVWPGTRVLVRAAPSALGHGNSTADVVWSSGR